jgi:hypothetical protein
MFFSLVRFLVYSFHLKFNSLRATEYEIAAPAYGRLAMTEEQNLLAPCND